MVCACSFGNWSTGSVNVQTVNTENVKNFLGMTGKFGDNGYWPNPLVTDEGVKQNSYLASLASGLISGYITDAAKGISDKQIGIARDYYNIAQQKWDRFKNIYQPCETKEVTEACNTPVYAPNYDETSISYIGEVNKDFTVGSQRLEDLYARYCIKPDPSLTKDLDLLQSQMAGDAANFAYRYEEARKYAKDDIRWNRRAQALNRGRDLQTTALRYADAAAHAFGDEEQALNRVGQGAATALGYFMNRRPTVYPQRTQMDRPGGSMVGNGFLGISPDNGTSGWMGNAGLISSGSLQIDEYGTNQMMYSTNNAISSMVGAQSPSSPGTTS